MILSDFTTDELLSELMRRDHVLLHRVRATLNEKGSSHQSILHHQAKIIIDGVPDGEILMEVMINGYWWGRDWKPVERPIGIHRSEYD